MKRAVPLIILFSLLAWLPGRAVSNEFGARVQSASQKPQQNQSSPPADERTTAMLRSLSPQLIEWFIDANEDVDLQHIWRLLKIDVANGARSKCNGDCSAETFDIELTDEQSTRAVALRISFKDGDYYQYLIFKSAGSTEAAGWRFIGSFDTNGQQDSPPRHRVERGSNRVWLVIREMLGSSPEAKAYAETWYEIKESTVNKVLRYPVEGRNESCQNKVDRSYKSLLLRHELENGAYTIPIQFLISYEVPDCGKGGYPLSLFAKAQRAYYVWDSNREQFLLDASRSELTEAEINSVYSIADLVNEQFVEYNFDKLSGLARGGDAKQKNWLKQFLTMLKDGARKTALQEILQQ